MKYLSNNNVGHCSQIASICRHKDIEGVHRQRGRGIGCKSNLPWVSVVCTTTKSVNSAITQYQNKWMLILVLAHIIQYESGLLKHNVKRYIKELVFSISKSRQLRSLRFFPHKKWPLTCLLPLSAAGTSAITLFTASSKRFIALAISLQKQTFWKCTHLPCPGFISSIWNTI